MVRKTRTRQHISADYSAIHFERFALDCAYSVERIFHDYGVDLEMHTFDPDGQVENGSVQVQLIQSVGN